MRRPQLDIQLKTPEQIELMRGAGLVVAAALDAMRDAVAPGVSTADLDAIAEKVIRDAGAVPSFKGYQGFPASICASVNEQVVHGIPSPEQILNEGDLLSLDCGAILNGWHGDSAITFGIGELSPAAAALSEATRKSMWAGIAAAHVGARVGDVAHAVETSVRGSKAGYGIVSEYTGHGIGSEMHQPPDVPNLGRPGRGELLVKGMCLAIEPMITAGSAVTATLDDEWTVVTRDGSPAAHWEHTVALTGVGAWVLTAEDGGEAELAARGVKFGPLGD